MRGFWTVLTLAALGLCGCAPQVTQAPSDGTSLFLTTGLNYQTVILQNGSRPATSAAMRLIGGPLRVNDKRCVVVGPDLVCTLGELPVGGKRTIYATGVSRVQAQVGRADGSTDTLDGH